MKPRIALDMFLLDLVITKQSAEAEKLLHEIQSLSDLDHMERFFQFVKERHLEAACFDNLRFFVKAMIEQTEPTLIRQ